MYFLQRWPLFFFQKRSFFLWKQKKNRAPQVALALRPSFFRNSAPGDLHSSCYLSGILLCVEEWGWPSLGLHPPSWLHLRMLMNSFLVVWFNSQLFFRDTLERHTQWGTLHRCHFTFTFSSSQETKEEKNYFSASGARFLFYLMGEFVLYV